MLHPWTSEHQHPKTSAGRSPRVSIRALDGTVSADWYEQIERRIQFAFGRVPQVQSIRVVLADINGQRGGIDQECIVEVELRGLGRVVTRASHASGHAAASSAVRRAAQATLRRLKRRQHRRLRRPAVSAES